MEDPWKIPMKFCENLRFHWNRGEWGLFGIELWADLFVSSGVPFLCKQIAHTFKSLGRISNPHVRPLRTCHARLLEQLPESQPCVLQQTLDMDVYLLPWFPKLIGIKRLLLSSSIILQSCSIVQYYYCIYYCGLFDAGATQYPLNYGWFVAHPPSWTEELRLHPRWNLGLLTFVDVSFQKGNLINHSFGLKTNTMLCYRYKPYETLWNHMKPHAVVGFTKTHTKPPCFGQRICFSRNLHRFPSNLLQVHFGCRGRFSINCPDRSDSIWLVVWNIFDFSIYWE